MREFNPEMRQLGKGVFNGYSSGDFHVAIGCLYDGFIPEVSCDVYPFGAIRDTTEERLPVGDRRRVLRNVKTPRFGYL